VTDPSGGDDTDDSDIDGDQAVADFDVAAELVDFVRALSAAGVSVPADASYAGAEALVALGRIDPDAVRAALRAALISDPADIEAFDRLFPAFWRRLVGEGATYPEGTTATGGAGEATDAAEGTDAEGAGDDHPLPGAGGGAVASGDEADAEGELRTARYSPTGDPDAVSADAVALRTDRSLDAAMRAFTGAVADLPGRRWTRSPGGNAVDARRALRRGLSTGGVPADLPERERRRTAARGTVLVDVSGSVLDTVDRGFLLRFLRELRARWRRTRIFFFDTSIREVTEAFDAPSLAAAVEALERAEAGWGGGTQIGEALSTLRAEHPETVDRTTTVIVVSDGLERGEVDLLAESMAWLSRRGARVLWLNPLATSPSYEPTARGMAAALHHLDGFYGFAAPEDVRRIADSIERYGPERRTENSHNAEAPRVMHDRE